ncbi:MAG: ATP phosphoribosyltransferase [Candidatus Brocadiae bacterium]|nr:ATP phosphoribosyltransferase [Candidatus Brocadiia bacterium]
MKLVLGLPKGSLQEATFALLGKAGFPISCSSRSYFPSTDDPELDLVLFRAQEMARYVQDGVLDAGLTGRDWVVENDADVVEVGELIYAKQRMTPVRWVLAVPEASGVQNAKELDGKLIATELVNTTRKYLASQGVEARVEFSWGATEAKAGLVDAIVELTETGSSLRANKLRIIDTVMESVTVLVANKAAWQDAEKRAKIESIHMLLQGAIAAREKVLLKLNVAEENVEAVKAIVPALRQPTLSPLAGTGWYALETVVDESVVRRIIPDLKRAGAEGIIELPLNKIIP